MSVHLPQLSDDDHARPLTLDEAYAYAWGRLRHFSLLVFRDVLENDTVCTATLEEITLQLAKRIESLGFDQATALQLARRE